MPPTRDRLLSKGTSSYLTPVHPHIANRIKLQLTLSLKRRWFGYNRHF
jgi:hypothetical protein